MADLVMNADGQLDHGSESTISGGSFSITSSPSVKTKAGGKGVYRGPLVFTFKGGNAPGFATGSVFTPSPVTINPAAQKVKAEFLPVVREGDSGTMVCQGTTTDVPPKTATVSGPVEVASAGQLKVRGE